MSGVQPHSIVQHFLEPSVKEDKDLKEFRKIEKIDENTWVFYFRFKIPLSSDRDNVMKIYTKDLGEGAYFICCTSIERDDIPLVPRVVRMF